MRCFLISCILFLFGLNTAIADSDTPFIDRPEVRDYIQTLVKKYHFNGSELTQLFSGVKVRKQIMRSMNKPLEKETWRTYQTLFVTERRIDQGVKFWNKYADALHRAELTYGVPASIIVATIGIETKYGERTGDYRVIDSLTNIAFSDSHRARYFRSELTEFLLLTREQHLNPTKIMGSYAGAIGQPQFMPSSYRNYAVNFSKSGKIDLMHNEVDVIGSIANYYKKNGWKINAPVATPVHMIGDRYRYLLRNHQLSQPMTVAELSQYGIITKKKFINDDLQARVIELKNRYSNEYWLGFHNFYVIKRYNASDLYAMAVYQLSGYIAGLKESVSNG